MTSDGGTIPIFLLTGFLGSGKTTLLSRLIRSEGFADTAVVINEFGDVGLDHILVSEGEEIDAVLLESGCLCCTLSGSLESTLEALYYKRERGEIPFFRRLVIETTGLADPSAIASSLSVSRVIARRFHLAAIVTTVDGRQGDAQIAAFDEARLQVLLADQILITKADEASTDELNAAVRRVAWLNPTAPRQPIAQGDIAAEQVFLPDAQSDAATRANQQAVAYALHSGHDHDHHGHGHLHEHGYVSRVLDAPDGLTQARYAAWVRILQKRLGERLLRVKGFARWEDGGLRALQGVRLVFDQPKAIDWMPPASAIGKIVLIGRDLSAEDLALAQNALAGQSAP